MSIPHESWPRPLREGMATEWMLQEGVSFLNHGSFGAVPRAVFDVQNQWRRRIEAEPIEILGRRWLDLLATAKAAIGQWLGMASSDFGMVTNATEGINAVLRSLPLGPGDELLTTNHVYNAVRQAMRHVAAQAGASYREIDIPLPATSADQIVQRVLSELSDRTRLLVIDHVTSPTALVFPIEPIAAGCERRNIDVLVDGAHAPGMLDLNVPNLGVAYYAGNLHKWACAPKGSAFLWVRPDRQHAIHPTIISHHLGQGFEREFDWQGTFDASAWLATPAAIDFMAGFGWDCVVRHNHDLAVSAHRMLCTRWKSEPISPLAGQLLGSMATMRLPGQLAQWTEDRLTLLQQRLYTEHRIEAPLIRWGNQAFVRVSCQVYNAAGDYQTLADVLEQLASRLG
jgi:isopenicillin-N epimerase